MTDVTQFLSQIEQGDPSAADQLLPLLYDELRRLAAAKLANEKPGQTRRCHWHLASVCLPFLVFFVAFQVSANRQLDSFVD